MSELCWPVVKNKKFKCCLKNNGVTTLTSWGHVTSSITWPFDSRWSTYYGWSIVTMQMHGRTHEHSGDFILCPMLLHCIGQTIRLKEVFKLKRQPHEENSTWTVMAPLRVTVWWNPTNSILSTMSYTGHCKQTHKQLAHVRLAVNSWHRNFLPSSKTHDRKCSTSIKIHYWSNLDINPQV